MKVGVEIKHRVPHVLGVVQLEDVRQNVCLTAIETVWGKVVDQYAELNQLVPVKVIVD